MTTENKEKFTPGPYTTKPETPYVAAQVWADGMLLADVYGESREARKANAQLFSAAPELYQTLQAAQTWIKQAANDLGIDSIMPEQIETVLLRARDESKRGEFPRVAGLGPAR